MSERDSNPPPQPEGSPALLLWPPRVRVFPTDHPARMDEESTRAFNEDWAKDDFGHAIFATIFTKHEHFCGDWWLLCALCVAEQYARRSDPTGRDTSRYREFNTFYDAVRSNRITMHLERANLARMDLRHVRLFDARLDFVHAEGTRFANSSLDGARLPHAQLRRADATGALLNRAVLSYAEAPLANFTDIEANETIFDMANLSSANLTGANLAASRFRNTYLIGARLNASTLLGACLDEAKLSRAEIVGATLDWSSLNDVDARQADLSHSVLVGAKLQRANLQTARLERAVLCEADLTRADVRETSGLRFDTNRVRDIHIGGDAPDPWSVLRRSYTGPWFFLHAALLIAFVLPYIGKVLALTAADHAGRAYENFAPHIPIVAVERIPAWRVLIGLDKAWWIPTLGGVLLVYNLIRGILTFRVGMLRDAEERSGITPSLAQYMGSPEQPSEEGAGAIRECLFLCVMWLSTQLDRLPIVPGKVEDEKPARFVELVGLWRLHRLLKLLFLVAITSFMVHVVHWAWTTTLPKIEINASLYPRPQVDDHEH